MKLNAAEKALMNNPVRAALQRRYEAKMLAHLGGLIEGGRTLEVGCGRGVGVEIILKRFGAASVDAFDFDPDMIARARRRVARFDTRVRLWIGDAAAIAAPDACYTTLCSISESSITCRSGGLRSPRSRACFGRGGGSSSKRFARLGPSDRQSGTSIRNAVPSRRGNHRLKNAMFLTAFASLKHPPSWTYYDRNMPPARDTTKRSPVSPDVVSMSFTRCSPAKNFNAGHPLRPQRICPSRLTRR